MSPSKRQAARIEYKIPGGNKCPVVHTNDIHDVLDLIDHPVNLNRQGEKICD